MTRASVALAVAATLLGGTMLAAADVVTYAASGSAASADADARTRALDTAFASAVTEAVADLAGKAARAKAAEVDREIVRRARRFVASYAVTAERAAGDRLELTVDVRVDRDKLRTRLLELGVELRAAEPLPEPGPPPVRGRTATLLYRVTGVGSLGASFGVTARGDLPGASTLEAALARSGYRAVAASAAGPAPDDDGELPVDDASARALAVDAGAEAALVVGVAVGEPGPVRGTPLTAAPVRAWLRLIDAGTGEATSSSAVATAAWGDRERLPVLAAERAAALVATRGLAAAPTPVASVDAGPPLVAGSGVTVRVVGPGAWQAAALVRADLVAAPGVTATSVAGVAGDTVALAVVGIGVDKAASIAKGTPGFAAKTRVVDGVVVVQVKALAAP